MPAPVLFLLIVLVAAYVLLAGIASLGFVLIRRQDAPPAPAEWPSVSVVVPDAASNSEALQQIQACDYPSGSLDLLVPTDGPVENSSLDRTEGAMVHPVPMPGRTTGAVPLLSHAAEVADGAVVLVLPPGGTPSSGWIRSMVQRCTYDGPTVVGPTIVEHKGLFLPRLQALACLGRLAFMGGTSYLGLPSPMEGSNRAVHVDDRSSEEVNEEISEEAPPSFNPDPEALVARPAVGSFEGFLRRFAHGFRDAFQSPSWLVRGQGIGLWLLHSLLLACSLVAVAVPAWRQPTLLALVATMGANVVLALPAAKHYGQRGLLRSVVPTVLALVIALPLAGLWAVVGPAYELTAVPLSGTDA